MHPSAFKMSVLALLTAGIGMIACAAPAADDVGEDGSAFSESTCKPRAEKAKKAAAEQCKKDNPIVDALKCMKPAENAYLEYLGKLSAARAPFQAIIDADTATCKAEVERLSDVQLIKDANPGISDALAVSKAKDTKEVARLEEQRKLACEVETKAIIEKSIPADSEYAKLLGQMRAEQTTFNRARAKCATDARLSKAANDGCTGEDAFDKEMKICRRECPKLSTVACTPKGYKGEVKCGRLVPQKSVSWQAKGMACGDEGECERTDVCEKYDVQQRNADSTNTAGGCTVGQQAGVSVAVVTFDSEGKATGAKVECTIAGD